MNELRQYKIENSCLQKEIANKLGYSESKVTRLMKKHCSLRKILPMDEYERVINELSNSESFEDKIILVADSAFGQYIPQLFCEKYYELIKDKEIADFLKNEDNLYHDLYWEYWYILMDEYTYTINGTEYILVDNMDIWLVPTSVTVPEHWYI
jgi:hypothetical protein